MGRLTESEKLTLGRPIGGHREQMNLGLDITDKIEQWAIDRGLQSVNVPFRFCPVCARRLKEAENENIH